MVGEAQLDTLESKGLIRLASYSPELEYLFRHWLVQDAAYGSLLKQERRELHRTVGEALEGLYPERRGELAAVLAMHFEQAGDSARALDYLTAAGHYALERNAIREAHSAFERASSLLPPRDPAEDDAVTRRRIEIKLGEARASMTFVSVEELVASLEDVLPDAERLGDLVSVAQLHLVLALNRLLGGQQPSDPAVRQSLERVNEIGIQVNDPSLRALPLALTGLTQVFTGPIREGVGALEEAVPLLESRHNQIGAAFARGALAMGYAELGEFERAEEATRNAYQLAAEGDLIARLDAQIADSFVRAMRGQLAEAGTLALACVNSSEDIGATACVMPSSWVLGDVYHRQGRFAEARAILERGMAISAIVDRRVWRPTLLAWLGSTAAALGELAAGEGDWDEALETVRSSGNRVGEAGIRWKRAEAASRSADWEEALRDFEASATIFEAEGALPLLARVLHGWGEALRGAGRHEEAADKLRRALTIFEQLGITTDAEAVRLALAGVGPLSYS